MIKTRMIRTGIIRTGMIRTGMMLDKSWNENTGMVLDAGLAQE